MKKTLINVISALALVTPGASMGVNIDFETPSSYKSIGVYDAWESSPFRLGTMTGNFGIVDNPMPDVDSESGTALNGSAKVLGAQRSRFGSNLFGVRVDLNEPVALSSTKQYVHVMMYRPNSGRVALVALGKRDDRTDQTGAEEQQWVLSSNTVEQNKWCDAVFPIKGSDNVKLYSFVIVPECESPHDRTEDFLFYVDDITVNNSVQPRSNQEEYYEINYDKQNAKLDRSDRATSSVTFTSPTFGAQTINVNQSSGKKLYHDLTNNVLKAKAGEKLSFNVTFTGSWMHAYVYIDRDDNGHFEPGVAADGYSLTVNGELVSHSFLGTGETGHDSNGKVISGNGRDTRTLPDYTLPADMKAGMYRVRYKVDWNSAEAGGSNTIITDGGVLVDFLLSVSDGNPVNISANQLNGDVANANGELLNATKIPFGQAFDIKMLPAPGFQVKGINVKHGWKLDGNGKYHNNTQYKTEYYDYLEFDENDCFTLPADVIDGDVMIEGLFVEDGTLPKKLTLTYKLVCDDEVIATHSMSTIEGSEYPNDIWHSDVSTDYYEIEYPEGTVKRSDADEPIEVILLQNLPFVSTNSLNNPIYYNITLAESKYYLQHSPGQSYISLSSTTKPDDTNEHALWAFVGNVIDGFKLYNKAAGNAYILSSSTTLSSNTGGSTFPIMKEETTLPAGYNTYWIPTVANHSTMAASLQGGFYMNQKGYGSNKMNYRDGRLAYWNGGADNGSTFLVERVTPEVAGLKGIEQDFDFTDAVYYSLQGIRVESKNLAPGIYIAKSGGRTIKILVK